MSKRKPWALAIGALLLVLLTTALAVAAGRIQWTKTAVKENADSKSWKLELKIFLPKAPDVAHVPVKFEFSPTAYYERAMLDGDKLTERRVPLEGRQDIIQGVDIGFMDPGTGKIEKGTMFSFKVTRALGFEAGEYKVTIRDARNGQVIGTPSTLKFEGENEIIDRRAMVFAAEDKRKKKTESKEGGEKAGGEKTGGEEKSGGGESGGGEESGGGSETPENPAEVPPDDEKPGEVKEKPGGCGCRLADTRGSPLPSVIALAGLALLALRRRRALI